MSNEYNRAVVTAGTIAILFVGIACYASVVSPPPSTPYSDPSCNVIQLSQMSAQDVEIKAVVGGGLQSIANGQVAYVRYNEGQCVIKVPAFGDAETIMNGDFDIEVTSRWNLYSIPTSVAVFSN